MDIHSNSQESLRLLKDKISNYAPTTTVEEIMKYVEKSVEDNELNPKKLVNKLIIAIDTAGEIRSPYYFVKKVVDNLIREHLDEVKDNKLIISFTPLWVDMKNHNFTGSDEDYVLITLVEEHCLYEFPVEIDEIIATNHAIFDYCLTKDTRTYGAFLEYLLRSKLLKKCNVPLEHLRELAKKRAEEYAAMLDYFTPQEQDNFNADD